VRYAQDLVFADEPTRRRTIAMVNAAHHGVEKKRGGKIPAWAYRDVLYMLVDYTERAHDVLVRPASRAEREVTYGYFRAAAQGLEIESVPGTYADYLADREAHMHANLVYSPHTDALYRAYRRHLGPWRYEVLRTIQAAIVPERVRALLGLRERPLVRPALRGYALLERLNLRARVQAMVVPERYVAKVRAMDRPALVAA
jgi:hypothetical protein